MRKYRKAKLTLTSLEDRLAPAASLVFQGGNLTITGDNTSNSIIVHRDLTGNAEVYVAPGYNPFLQADLPAPAQPPYKYFGNYALTGTLTINTGNSSDAILVSYTDDPLNTTSISGDVRVNSGNSPDTIVVQSDNSIATMAGRVTLNGGLGGDDISIIGLNVQGTVDVNGGGGGLAANALPNDIFRVFTSNIAGNVTVLNATTALDDQFGPSTLQSNLVVSNSTATPVVGYVLGLSALTYNFSNVLFIDGGSQVNGSATYIGSSAADAVYILGEVDGNLTVSAGAGNNVFSLGNTADPIAQPRTINGSLTWISGAGNDSMSLSDNSQILGSAAFTMGDGNNSFDLNFDNAVVGDAAFQVNGDLTLNGGNGNDVMGNMNGIINGALTINAGNGANSVAIRGTVNSNVRYTGGGGVDSVTVGGINAFALNVNLGAGNDQFNFDAASSVGSSYLDFGAGTHGYADGGNLVTWNQTIINL